MLTWRYQRYALLENYHTQPPFPPPLNLLYYVVRFLLWILSLCRYNAVVNFDQFKKPLRIPYDGIPLEENSPQDTLKIFNPMRRLSQSLKKKISFGSAVQDVIRREQEKLEINELSKFELWGLKVNQVIYINYTEKMCIYYLTCQVS